MNKLFYLTPSFHNHRLVRRLYIDNIFSNSRVSIALLSPTLAFFLLFSVFNIAWADEAHLRLRGVNSTQVSIPVYVSGSGRERDWGNAAGCRLDRAALERYGVELMQAAGLDALTQDEVLNRLQKLQQELVVTGRMPREPAPSSPPSFQEEGRRRMRAFEDLGNLPVLYVRVAVEPIAGGLCAVGMVGELRAFAQERPVVAETGNQILAPLRLWEGPPIAFASTAPALQSTTEERLKRVTAALVSALRVANGR